MKDDREQSRGGTSGGSSISGQTQPDDQPRNSGEENIVSGDDPSRGWVDRYDPGTPEANDEGGIPPPGGEDEGSRGW